MIVESSGAITLVGGGALPRRDLALAMARAPRLVAVDGGANRLADRGLMPEAVIGDMDSLRLDVRAVLPATVLHEMAEQDSTDFDKALRSVRAPLVLAVGFQGARLDHGLAVLTALVVRAQHRCIVIGATDIVFHAPPSLCLKLPQGDRLSLFPLARVTGRSTGLRWPIDGIDFAPDGMIGTSNQVVARQVRLEFDAPGMLVILPRRRLDAAIAAVTGQ
ncbi:MAG: thiamine diphosphokinase [Pseudomonadota bacterium]